MKFSGKVENWQMNKWLNFSDDPDPDPDTAPDPDRDTGKTCLGGGMHCPSVSSLFILLWLLLIIIFMFFRFVVLMLTPLRRSANKDLCRDVNLRALVAPTYI